MTSSTATLLSRTTLGRTNIEVSRLCLGGNVFGWNLDQAASFAVLDAFYDAGGTFIDTADVYSAWAPGNKGGESEATIGAWIKSRGHAGRVTVATKVGMQMGDGSGGGLSREHIVHSAEASLKRLGIDAIDLYYAHRDSPDTALDETLAAFDELVRAGKVRAVGASNYTAERLTEALAVSARGGLTRFEVLQPAYNLVDRAGVEGRLQQVCREEHISIAPYYSLASGFLTGKYRKGGSPVDSMRASGVLSKYGNDDGWRVIHALDSVAARHEASPAQIALAWLATREAVATPIASATTPAQVAELVGAFSLQLNSADIEELNVASDPFTRH